MDDIKYNNRQVYSYQIRLQFNSDPDEFLRSADFAYLSYNDHLGSL